MKPLLYSTFTLSLLLLAGFGTALAGVKQPPLIPQPREVVWGKGEVNLRSGYRLSCSVDSLTPCVQRLTQLFPQPQDDVVREPVVTLVISDDTARYPHAESYGLDASPGAVKLTARTVRGLHHALSTLVQLASDGPFSPVSIRDTPAFSWRGYMVDVGRNYQSMALLKEQIDAMALLKLNVFHFHMTENVAWRIAIDRYPWLTAPEHMTRDHGLYYREADIRELMQYCADRGILFLPEIDMPGHSEAFSRAMETDMQSEEGLQIVLHILDEVLEKYGFRYLHIGADEVRIQNEAFIPTVVDFLEKKGVTVVGWQPGGNYPDTVWRQLWSDDNAHSSDAVGAVQIDSRNLYINHIDALEVVPLLFNHMICDVPQEEGLKKGATLCLWNDRRLRRGEDNLTHNPVYPALMAFAERVWRGGGKVGNFVGIEYNEKPLAELADLEERMLGLRERLFPKVPFPYTRQTDQEWAIFGPYDNGGATTASFEIENATSEMLAAMVPDTTLIGGTIIFRHFWHPTIKGHFLDLQPNSTFYAYRRIYSEVERVMPTWISLYDYSRSQHADSPALGSWNRTSGTLWVNGEEITPPFWLRGGQEGDLEIPYEDENYSMRAPYPIHLRAGWNTILIKVPIGTFQAPVWYYPHKWMFTFIEAPTYYAP